MDRRNPYYPDRLAETLAGFKDITPVVITYVPIGLLFGAIAAAKGLSLAEVTLMSLLVFAGGSQLAAVETWVNPVPIATLAFATLLINARYVLMGASLAPKVQASGWRKFLSLFFMTDESWALAERRALDRRVTDAYWFAMAAILTVVWVGSTALGAILRPPLGGPEAFGADFAFTALFIGLITGFGRNRVTLITIAASAAISALVYTVVGAPWHVTSGALAGIGMAYLVARPEVEA